MGRGAGAVIGGAPRNFHSPLLISHMSGLRLPWVRNYEPRFACIGFRDGCHCGTRCAISSYGMNHPNPRFPSHHILKRTCVDPPRQRRYQRPANATDTLRDCKLYDKEDLATRFGVSRGDWTNLPYPLSKSQMIWDGVEDTIDVLRFDCDEATDDCRWVQGAHAPPKKALSVESKCTRA